MSNRIGSLKSRALMTSSAAVLGVALASSFGGAALAQSCPPDQTMVNGKCAPSTAPQEIVVTGSRIVRRDYTSQSPIVTLNSDALQTTANVGIEQALGKLPQFVAGANQVTGSFNVQSTAVSTPGSSTLNLRGLGANRNLVLVDGRRAQPIDASLDIDINTIPESAIDSIETITGGAASTYGSDAISGVVNFKLKQNFQGLQYDAQWGESQQSDDKETKIDMLVGGNFADDKGNVMIGVGYTNRTSVMQRDRDFFSKAYTDPTVAGDFFPDILTLSGASALNGNTDGLASIFPGGPPPPAGCTPFVNCFITYPYSGAALGAIFGANAPDPLGATINSFGGGIGINPAPNPANATVYYTGHGGFFGSGAVAPGFNLANSQVFVGGAPLYKFVNTNGFDGVTTNAVNQMLSLPLTRYSMFASGHYDINDNVTAYVQGNFVEAETLTILGSNPAVNQWGTFVPYCPVDGTACAFDGSNAQTRVTDPLTGVTTIIQSPHLVPSQIQTLLQSRSRTLLSNGTTVGQNNTDTWELGRGLDRIIGPRSQDQHFNTYQILGGFKGKLPFFQDLGWTYDIYGSHGNTAIDARYLGFIDSAKYNLLTSLPNYGAGAGIKGTVVLDNLGNPTGVVNNLLFVPNRGTVAHCTSGLNPFSSAPVSQDCLDIINAPITTTTDVNQDVLEADFQGKLFDLPAGELRAAIGADYRRDAFLYRPDPSMSQSNILGSTVGIFGAAQGQGETAVGEGYGELLIPVLKDLPLVKNFTVNAGYRFSSYDQSSIGGVSTWKITTDWSLVDWFKVRGGYQSASRAPNTAELFQQGNTQVTFWADGDPCVTGQVSYGNNGTLSAQNLKVLQLCNELALGTPVASGVFPVIGQNFGSPSPFNLSLDNQVGTPTLHSETAATWTAGFVVSSPFDTALLKRLTMSVDYYNIRISDAIGVLTAQSIYTKCFNADGASNPTYDPNFSFCKLINRSSTNGIALSTTAPYGNLGGVKTSGADVQLNWAADIADFGLPVPGSLSVDFYFNWVQEYDTRVGTAKFANYVGTAGDGTFTEGISQPEFRDQSTTTFGYTLGPLGVNVRWKHLPGVTAVAKKFHTQANAQTIQDTGNYDIFDLFGTYRINDTYNFRAGVENLFDVQPEISARNLAGANPTSGQGVTYNGAYDVIGRRFFLGVTAKY